MGFALVIEPVFGGRGIDRHAADGITGKGAAGGMVAVVMNRVIVISVAAACARIAGVRHRFSRPLATHTPWGYIDRMRKDIKASCQKRLSRIEGQVRGLSKMVDEDRYCIDIVTQISAVRAALRRVEEEVLRDHVSHCVEHAISSGNKTDQREKIAELMAVIGRSDR